MSSFDKNILVENAMKIGLAYFLIGAIIIITIYTSNKDTGIIPDDQSSSRLSTLNEVLISYFGTSWVYILLFIFTILICIMFLLYKNTNTDININIDDHNGNILIKLILILIFIIIISIITIAIRSYLSDKAKKDGSGIPDYIPGFDADAEKQKKQQSLMIIGAGSVLLFILILLFHYFWTKYIKHQAPNI